MKARQSGNQHDPLERCLWVCEHAGALAAEAFYECSSTSEATVADGTTTIRRTVTRGVGVRVVHKSRTGYAYTARLSDQSLLDAIERARAASEVAHGGMLTLVDNGWRAGPNASYLRTPDPFDLGASARALAEISRQLAPAGTQVTAMSASRQLIVAIASTVGTRGAYSKRVSWCTVRAVVAGSGGRQAGSGYWVGTDLDRPVIQSTAIEAIQSAAEQIGSRAPAAGERTVVFDARAASHLVRFFESALAAPPVGPANGFLTGRLGSQVAGTALSLVDDGLLAGGPGSRPFDDEGVPSNTTTLMDRGVLVGLLHNWSTATRQGVLPTSNGSRAGYSEPPGIAATNMYIRPGVRGLGSIVADVENGLLVTSIEGQNVGINPVTGLYSLRAHGKEIHRGEAGGGVRFGISGRIEDLLRNVEEVGAERRFRPYGAFFAGTPLLVSNVPVFA